MMTKTNLGYEDEYGNWYPSYSIENRSGDIEDL